MRDVARRPDAAHAEAPAPDRGQRDVALRRLRAVFLFALLMPTAAYLLVAAYLYREAFADAHLRLDRAARIGQEQALTLFETNQMLLQRMLDLVGTRSDEQLLADAAGLHLRLRFMAAGLPQVQGLYVHGADARSVATSRLYPPPRQIDYADREWHRAHRDGAESLVFVTEQQTSRATGEPFFDMSRRRIDASGRFAGTVHASLRPSHLNNFYAELAKAEPGLRMTLARDDGRVLVRFPAQLPQDVQLPAAHPLLARFAAKETVGMENGVSPFDGVQRLRAFRRIGAYPLYVVAGIDRELVVAGWARRIGLLALFLLPTTLGFAWMARLALRRTEQEFAAADALHDETARRQRAELALMQSQKLEAMGRLTGGVAHDFNNVLTVVMSNLYLHRRMHPAIAASAQLAAIDRAIDSGTKVTRQLLAFSRRQALRPERITLSQRLPALLDLLRPVLGSPIQLTGAVAPDTADIEVDAAELELALINLAVNAKDAMPEGGRLDITASNAAPGEFGQRDAAYVLLEASDTGSGIDPAIAAQAFEPFFTTKPVGQGTGLGLAQVQALCQSGGGDARIAPRPGGGTRVLLYFRALAPAATMDAAAAPGVAPALSLRLLLVEDNETVAASTGAMLEAMGCRVQHAASGTAAQAWLQAHPADAVDAVLSDIEMPGGMDGIALATWLARHRPGLPVVLTTGYAARLEQATRRRFQVLPKPCSPSLLADTLRAALSGRSAGAAEAAA